MRNVNSSISEPKHGPIHAAAVPFLVPEVVNWRAGKNSSDEILDTIGDSYPDENPANHSKWLRDSDPQVLVQNRELGKREAEQVNDNTRPECLGEVSVVAIE